MTGPDPRYYLRQCPDGYPSCRRAEAGGPWCDKGRCVAESGPEDTTHDQFDTAPNWEATCTNCGDTPTVGALELCGPCCWGEAETRGGNW